MFKNMYGGYMIAVCSTIITPELRRDVPVGVPLDLSTP